MRKGWLELSNWLMVKELAHISSYYNYLWLQYFCARVFNYWMARNPQFNLNFRNLPRPAGL